jgi:hypothetical protein
VVFVRSARCRRRRRWLVDSARRSRRARRADDPARAWSSRAVPLLQRDVADPRCPRSGWPRRRCSASCSARLDAVHRPDARRITTLSLNEARAARGAALGVYALGLGLPFIVAGLAYGGRSARSLRPPPPAWVTRLGGPDAGRGRRAARHRLVGPGRARGCRSTWSTTPSV